MNIVKKILSIGLLFLLPIFAFGKPSQPSILATKVKEKEYMEVRESCSYVEEMTLNQVELVEINYTFDNWNKLSNKEKVIYKQEITACLMFALILDGYYYTPSQISWKEYIQFLEMEKEDLQEIQKLLEREEVDTQLTSN